VESGIRYTCDVGRIVCHTGRGKSEIVCSAKEAAA
jgi:hypothetical protein